MRVQHAAPAGTELHEELRTGAVNTLHHFGSIRNKLIPVFIERPFITFEVLYIMDSCNEQTRAALCPIIQIFRSILPEGSVGKNPSASHRCHDDSVFQCAGTKLHRAEEDIIFPHGITSLLNPGKQAVCRV